MTNPVGSEPVPDHLRLEAVAQLLTAAGPKRQAARRFIASAPRYGIDLGMLWYRRRTGTIRQVCLPVFGAGRTAMLFVSGRRPWERAPHDLAERASLLDDVCAHLFATHGNRVALVQLLPEPDEWWTTQSAQLASFQNVGELAYLRRDLPASTPDEMQWPSGVHVRPVGGLDDGHPDRGQLLGLLSRTYENTLDCPELCGMRSPEDVLDSHRSVGQWDPAIWWLLFEDGEARGCALFNHSPDQQSVELVYLGLEPSVRSRGLGSALLMHGLRSVANLEATHAMCAVDRRNTPALRLYARAGFEEFTGRTALVRSPESPAQGSGASPS